MKGRGMQPEEHVGTVRSYSPETQMANVRVDKGHLELGDVVHFQGTDADFEEAVTALRQNREPVESADEGQEAEVRVRHPVSEGTEVRLVRDPYEDDRAELLGQFFGRGTDR